MLSGVGFVCFASSYAVAWGLELTRLAFRSRVRGLAMILFAAAGMIAHAAFLYWQAVKEGDSPLSSEQDWYLVAAFALAGVYLYLALAHPKIPFGLFLLPLVLMLLGAARWLADPTPLGREPASQAWGAVHGLAIVASTVAVFIGFTAGVMYFAQTRRLKRKRLAADGLRLPSLEWLQWTNSRATMFAALMLGVGILSGAILNRINAGRQAMTLGWTDPVVVATLAMFFWLLAAVVYCACGCAANRGRKVALLTVASFVVLAIALAVGLFFDARHWGRGGGFGDLEIWRFGDLYCAEQVVPRIPASLAHGMRPVGLVDQSRIPESPNPESRIPNPESPNSFGGRPC
jgi:ABC-type uncharacterized transport system permease subunit